MAYKHRQEIIGQCDRCGTPIEKKLISKMNNDKICLDCLKDETKHPNYKMACSCQQVAIGNGNYNYKKPFSGKKYPFNI